MYMENYTSDNFAAAKGKSDLVIIPVGSLEAHGHHLPLGTDIFSPRLFCKKLDEKIGDEIWIAPQISYGQSYDLSIYPGTINVPSEVMAEYVYWVGKGMYDNGMRKLIFMNGHGGNNTALNLAAEKLEKIGMDVLVINWWMDYSKEIKAITGGQGHAGEDESSAVLYYDASLVKMDKATKNFNKPILRVKYKNSAKYCYHDAMSGDATKATYEFGEKIFASVTESMIRDIRVIESGKYYTEG
jgi:creatinine amidohydrolase